MGVFFLAAGVAVSVVTVVGLVVAGNRVLYSREDVSGPLDPALRRRRRRRRPGEEPRYWRNPNIADPWDYQVTSQRAVWIATHEDADVRSRWPAYAVVFALAVPFFGLLAGIYFVLCVG